MDLASSYLIEECDRGDVIEVYIQVLEWDLQSEQCRIPGHVTDLRDLQLVDLKA